MIGINASVTDLIMVAYQQMPPRMHFSEPAPAGKYDFIANLPKGSMEALRQKIEGQFGMVAHKEVTNTDIFVLNTSDPEKLKTNISKKKRPHRDIDYDKGKITIEDEQISELTDFLEGWLFRIPVLNRSGLSGRYDLTLRWDSHDKSKRIPTITEELNQVGLELVHTNMPIEMLVVEKAK